MTIKKQIRLVCQVSKWVWSVENRGQETYNSQNIKEMLFNLPNRFKLCCIFYIRFDYMKNSRAKLVFSCPLSCEKENIICCFLNFSSFVIEFFRNSKTIVNRRHVTHTKDIITSPIAR